MARREAKPAHRLGVPSITRLKGLNRFSLLLFDITLYLEAPNRTVST